MVIKVITGPYFLQNLFEWKTANNFMNNYGRDKYDRPKCSPWHLLLIYGIVL